MNNSNRAVALFEEGFNCSQAVFSAYSERSRLDNKTAAKIASGFGGGMRMAETCGAVTGALMVIGLKFGAAEPGDTAAKQKTYELVKDFTNRFKARRGSVICRDLLGCDISTPEGTKSAQEKNLFDTLCPKLIADVAEILEQVLSENDHGA
ncbi:MAG: C-GCAxxG-C-C family protein [Planctomycetota bacterium]|jgi:C_GCAxxG_C_C family probable redox protein